MENEKKGVHLVYSAAEQREVEAIRAKYQTTGERRPSNLDKLRKLDAKVESTAMVVGLNVGILSTLVFGVGMCCFLVWDLPLCGVLAGLTGLAGMIGAWPLYRRTLQKARDKAVPEILRLSEEQE